MCGGHRRRVNGCSLQDLRVKPRVLRRADAWLFIHATGTPIAKVCKGESDFQNLDSTHWSIEMNGALTSSRNRKPRSLQAMPFHDLGNMLSRLWEDDSETWLAGAMNPSVDLSETPATIDVKMDLPGIAPPDIDIRVHQNLLTVSGERKQETEEKERTYHRIERRSGGFSRTISLPCNVVEDEVAAEYKDGILTVKLPKCEEAQARKIEVKT